MNDADLQHSLDDIFDQALVYHGFADYMRDYELFVYCTADPQTGIRPRHERYLFKTCVHAVITTAVPAEVWARSLDERLIDYDTGVGLGGYVWGVKWQMLYPGAHLVIGSDTAEQWSRALGFAFHEVRIETNAHSLSLVFSNLEVTEVGPGYSPFTVGPAGPDSGTPLA